MNTKDQQARAFALAIAAIRSDAETLDDAPLYCDRADRKTYRYVDHLPRKEYRLPTPGNPRGMIVSAPAARDSLNALADRLEKGARAFGGTQPNRDRSLINTRGIVAARNAHAEGHRNAAHRAIGDRLFIAASGDPFAIVSQMQAAGHDVLLCRSIAARSNTIIAFCARSGARLATAGNSSAPADFNDFCAWLKSRAADYSGRLASMASLDQAAAVADYLDGDTVEAIDPDAEPCDTTAAIARAEAIAKPEPEPEPVPVPDPDPVPVPVPEPVKAPPMGKDLQSIPDFASASEADAWWRNRATSYPSQAAYRATQEYAEFVRKTAPLYARDKANASATMAETMQAAGVAPGDRVATTQAGAYLNTMTLTGTIVMRGGIPWVSLDEKIYTSRKGRVSEASRVRWSPAWQPIQEAESTEPRRDPASHAPTASPSPSPSPSTETDTDTDTATPRLPSPHQNLAQVPDKNASHGAGPRTDATTTNFTRTDSAPVGTYPVSHLSRHRTRWRTRRTEDVRRNPSQPGLNRNHNARRWRDQWTSTAHDPPLTRAGSMPPCRDMATGARDSNPCHHSIQGCRLSMARKLHKPPDQKATRPAGSSPLHNITRASRGLTITNVEPTK